MHQLQVQTLAKQNRLLSAKLDLVRAGSADLQQKVLDQDRYLNNFVKVFGGLAEAWNHMLSEQEWQLQLCNLSARRDRAVLLRHEQVYRDMKQILHNLPAKIMGVKSDQHSDDLNAQLEAFSRRFQEFQRETWMEQLAHHARLSELEQSIGQQGVTQAMRGVLSRSESQRSEIMLLSTKLAASQKYSYRASSESVRQKHFSSLLSQLIQDKQNLTYRCERLQLRLRVLTEETGADQEQFGCVCGGRIVTRVESGDSGRQQLEQQLKLKEAEVARLLRRQGELQMKVQQLKAERRNVKQMLLQSNLYSELVGYAKQLVEQLQKQETKLAVLRNDVATFQRARTKEVEEWRAKPKDYTAPSRQHSGETIKAIEAGIAKSFSQWRQLFARLTQSLQKANASGLELVSLRGRTQELLDSQTQLTEQCRKKDEAIQRLELRLGQKEEEIAAKQVGKVDLKEIKFRHQKIKTILQKIQEAVKGKPELSDGLSELMKYVRSRDSKIEVLEKGKVQATQSAERQARIIKMLEEDSKLSAGKYSEQLSHSNELVAQLRALQDKLNSTFQQSIEQKHKSDLLELQLSDLRNCAKEENAVLAEVKKLGFGQDVRALLAKQAQERALFQAKAAQHQKNNQQLQCESNSLRRQVQILREGKAILERALQKKVSQAVKNEHRLAEALAGRDRQESRVRLQTLEKELTALRGRLACGVCLTQDKSTVLNKCGHMLCGNCARELCEKKGWRECPFCKLLFVKEEVIEVSL